jgi:hypothetical protein
MLWGVERGIRGNQKALYAGVECAFRWKKVDACGIRAIKTRGWMHDADQEEDRPVGECCNNNGRRQEKLDAVPMWPVKKEGGGLQGVSEVAITVG